MSEKNTKSPRTHEEELVPAPGAVFKGSFATNLRSGPDADSCLSHLQHESIWTYLTDGWSNVAIYKSAFIEAVASMLLYYLNGVLHITFAQYGKWVPNWVGITNTIVLTLFIFATATSSGGHLNPLISFGTFLVGLTALPRAFLYMTAQLTGAAVAGALMRGSFSEAVLVKNYGGGCFFDQTAKETITQGQAFLIETMSSFMLLFLAFGCSLDPRQQKNFGPVLSPFLAALILGIISFASSGLVTGYAGAGLNPARCFAFGVSRGNFADQWIWWFGPCAGSLLAAIVYRAVPPYHLKKIQGLPVSEQSSSAGKGEHAGDAQHEHGAV